LRKYRAALPANNSPVYVAPARIHPYTTTGPATLPKRGNVIIIPKRLLDKPLKEFTTPPAKVALAK
jgi:hypothetical protein